MGILHIDGLHTSGFQFFAYASASALASRAFILKLHWLFFSLLKRIPLFFLRTFVIVQLGYHAHRISIHCLSSLILVITQYVPFCTLETHFSLSYT
jgi:hypothetical protein